MSEKLQMITVLLLFVFCGAWMIRQEQKNQELENRNAALRQENAELQKQTRINAQDVDFLEKLVIEGKQ